ncbi:MAG: DUF4093 domain-containing protein [Clostridia bacterium]|nr:DUF4093 domain-containing protein [Clostridia bacterium]
MIKLKMPIIVEGKYDKITLENVVDTLIISTDGFRIFKNKEMCDLIRTLAKEKGIIIMTDSDGAGQVIRNHIKNIAADGEIINVYVPQLKGKEKRKNAPSKEGFLGVEGLSKEVLTEALLKYGVLNDGVDTPEKRITKVDFYNLSLSGTENSGENRKKLILALGLPSTLSSSALLEVVNTLYTYDEFVKIAEKILN